MGKINPPWDSVGRRITERRIEVARLTKEGKSERKIAELLEVSRTTVWTDKRANKAFDEMHAGGL